MNQCDRVRRLLDQRGPQGISQADFDSPCADGFNHIPQIARRVGDLRKEGWAITTVTREGYCTYVWTKYLSPVVAENLASDRRVGVGSDQDGLDQERSGTSPQPVSDMPTPLFDVPASPRSAIWDEAA